MTYARIDKLSIRQRTSPSLEPAPHATVPTFQAPTIDRLHGLLDLPFGDHNSQIAVTLGQERWKYFAIGTTGPRPRYQSRHP
jgi:hypothetical protein